MSSPAYSRIPVNLVFADGAILHIQIFPDRQRAMVFGGFASLSPELVAAFEYLNDQGNQYPKMSSLLPYEEEDITYLRVTNHISGEERVRSSASSRHALF